MPKDKLTINGPTKSWAGKGSSGQDVHRIFCSECGSPIAHDPDAAPPIIAIKAGTLDSEIKKTLKPVRLPLFAPFLAVVVNKTVANNKCVNRIPRSGPLASFPSARKALPTLSLTCRNKCLIPSWNEINNENETKTFDVTLSICIP